MTDDARDVLRANQAFYDAFEARDRDAMERAWSRRDDLVCVHPGARPLLDRPSVLRSWRTLLAGDGAPHVTVDDTHARVVGDLAFVVCREWLSDEAGAHAGALVATNVFVREDGGWRMLHHHAGPTPVDPLELRLRAGGGGGPLN